MMCSAPGPVPDGLDGRSQIDSAVLVLLETKMRTCLA